MTAADRELVAGWLAALPEVKWDRLVEGGDVIRVYGWIARDDERADFVLLDFDNRGVSFVTSSARHSEEFARRLFGEVGHVPCQRVDEVLGAELEAARAA